MSNVSTVAKPAEPRPIGGGALRDCDAVEVAADAIGHLRDLADFALEQMRDANTRLVRMAVERPDLADETAEARAAALCACDHIERIRAALDAYVTGADR